ncbi:uncharacterized [Tachysurus ichikawai]
MIAEASGGRCQPWMEKIRYTKKRRKGQVNKGLGEGWKGAGIGGGNRAGTRMAFSSHFLLAASKGHLSEKLLRFHMVVLLNAGGHIMLLKGSSCAHPAFYYSYCMSTPTDNELWQEVLNPLLNPISKHRGTLISSLSPTPFTLRLRAGRVGVRKSHHSHRSISNPHTRTYKRAVLEEVTVQLRKVTQSFRRGCKKQPSFTGCLSGP